MRTVYDTETDEALRRATDAVTTALPEVADIIDRARSGQLTEEQAVAELTTLVSVGGRDLALRLQDLVIPAPDGRGLPRLNPTYEASLVERVQYDGDVPQLRFGPMAPGTSPAVPVDTDARDPIAIGLMLAEAASAVAVEAERLEAETARQITAAAESGDWSELAPRLPDGVRRLLPAQGTPVRVEDLQEQGLLHLQVGGSGRRGGQTLRADKCDEAQAEDDHQGPDGDEGDSPGHAHSAYNPTLAM